MIVGWTELRRRRTLSPPSKPGPTGELCVSLAAPATIHGSSTATPPSSRCPERAAKPTHTRTHTHFSLLNASLSRIHLSNARVLLPPARGLSSLLAKITKFHRSSVTSRSCKMHAPASPGSFLLTRQPAQSSQSSQSTLSSRHKRGVGWLNRGLTVFHRRHAGSCTLHQ